MIYLLSAKLGMISRIYCWIFIFYKIKNKTLVSLTEVKNKKVKKVNDIYSDISNLASAVRVFNSKHILYPLFELHYARQRISEVKFKNYNNFYNIIFSAFPVLATIFIIYFGAQEVVNQNLSIGGLVGINILNARMFSPILKFSFSSIVNSDDSNNSSETEKLVNENLKGVNPKIISGLLVLKDLSIGYSNSKELLFQRLNCTIPSGGIVVINGYNSAGKTSLCKSLLGLVKPLKGSILFDNIELNKYDISWLRRQISYLPQEVELFNLSIKDNILVNLSETQLQQTNDRVLLKTISSVGLTDYINKIPDGINQMVENNGKNLPVGIKKRIGIARAIINNGKFIIFDEPSESLDNKGVFDLYKILNNFIKLKKTLIIASHDPNILKSANIVIDLSTKPIPRIGVRKKKKN